MEAPHGLDQIGCVGSTSFHLEGLAEDGEAAPEPFSLEEIMAIAENKDGVAVPIETPVEQVKSVRVNVTQRR